MLKKTAEYNKRRNSRELPGNCNHYASQQHNPKR
jgi:hypothetical protein